MKTNKNTASVQGTAPVQGDLMAMFQQFLAMQGIPASIAPTAPVASPVTGKVASVKSKASKKPAKQAESVPAKSEPVRIHKLANSFFVIGDNAPAKLAEFFTRKPHLDRGFKERDIAGIGKVKAYWFGARQLAKIERILNAK